MTTQYAFSQKDNSATVRLLFPFFVSCDDIRPLIHAITTDTWTMGDRKVNVWSIPTDKLGSVPHDLYLDEILPQARAFLFSDPSSDQKIDSACIYAKVNPEVTNHVLRTVLLSTPVRVLQISAQSLTGIELFLSGFGVGVLSISIKLTSDELGVDDLQAACYALCQRHRHTMPWLRIPHPSDDPAVWDRIPEEQKERVSPPPEKGAGLMERLSRPGGQFQLREFVERLLSPLSPWSPKEFHDQFIAYSIARFDNAYQEQLISESDLIRRMVSLAQTEEVVHPGTPLANSDVPRVLLNSNQAVAASSLGTAQFLVDQPGSISFNDERVPRALIKYFSPYVLALIQRLILHRLEQRASQIALNQSDAMAKEVALLRTDLLRFTLLANLMQFSNRHAVNRYYKLSQLAFCVPESLAAIRETVADIDARANLLGQLQTLHVVRENTHHLAIAQARMELVEVFILAIYGAEVGHKYFEFAQHEGSGHHTLLFYGSLISGAVIGAVIGIFLTRILRMKLPKSESSDG